MEPFFIGLAAPRDGDSLAGYGGERNAGGLVMQRLVQTLGGVAAGLLVPVMAAAFSSYAIVHDNGSLNVGGRTVWLYGIDIPLGNRTCLTFLTPARCGPKAVLMLELKIGSHFVHCRTRSQNPDGSVAAVCRVDGVDLSGWMLEQGWAVAGADAPPSYQVLQRQAKEQQRGIWNLFPSGIIQPRDGSRHP